MKFDKLTFDQWLEFVFDEKWKSNPGENGYLDLEDLGGDIEVFVENCIVLFKKPDVLLERFTADQLESGFFHFILSPRVSLCWYIWDAGKSAEKRKELIGSTVNVFEQVFTKIVVWQSCFMWWDSLRNFSEDCDSNANQWIYDALARIIKIDSADCQLSALHGLGHLEHREKKALIEEFLRRNPGFEAKEYAVAAIEGKVL